MARRSVSVRQVARELGCSRNTVKRYLRNAQASRYGRRSRVGIGGSAGEACISLQASPPKVPTLRAVGRHDGPRRIDGGRANETSIPRTDSALLPQPFSCTRRTDPAASAESVCRLRTHLALNASRSLTLVNEDRALAMWTRTAKPSCLRSAEKPCGAGNTGVWVDCTVRQVSEMRVGRCRLRGIPQVFVSLRLQFRHLGEHSSFVFHRSSRRDYRYGEMVQR
jgi:hypothetical protein